jgi:hypothetical protein
VTYSRTDAYRSSYRSEPDASPVSGIIDSIFALISIALVVAASLAAMHAWIEPGWMQIPILAGLYLLVRAVVRHLFDTKSAWGPKLVRAPASAVELDALSGSARSTLRVA